MKMAPKNVQKFDLIFSDLLEIPTFGYFEICSKFWLKCYQMPLNDYISYMNVCCDICSNGSHFEYHFEKKSVHHICQDFQLKENDPKDKEHILGVHFH